jgi:hypothetical protein
VRSWPPKGSIFFLGCTTPRRNWIIQVGERAALDTAVPARSMIDLISAISGG